jgi:mono/diheme cytochrome c family protein
VAVDGDRVVTYAAFDRVLVSAPVHAKDSCGRSKDSCARVEVSLGAGKLDAQLARGRRLFFRNDKAISEAGLACASCHVDGREDGLVWRLQGARLQTPSLAGRLSDSAPFNWHGTTKTLPENIAQTIERLGGGGLSEEDRAALARYLRVGLRPVRAAPAGEPELVAQGRKVFHDRAVGCASCHDSTAGFTDGEAHDVETFSALEKDELKQALGDKPLEATAAAFDTPTLRQVGFTAPYFHDGSAPTLEALVEGNRDRMGKTSQLSATDRKALVAYLRTL